MPELMEFKLELAAGKPKEVRSEVVSSLHFVDAVRGPTSFVGWAKVGYLVVRQYGKHCCLPSSDRQGTG